MKEIGLTEDGKRREALVVGRQPRIGHCPPTAVKKRHLFFVEYELLSDGRKAIKRVEPACRRDHAVIAGFSWEADLTEATCLFCRSIAL